MTKEEVMAAMLEMLPYMQALDEIRKRYGIRVATVETRDSSTDVVIHDAEVIFRIINHKNCNFEALQNNYIVTRWDPKENKLTTLEPIPKKKGDGTNGSTKENPEHQTPEAAAAEPDAGGGA